MNYADPRACACATARSNACTRSRPCKHALSRAQEGRKPWNANTNVPQNEKHSDEAPKTLAPEVARAIAMFQAVAPMTIAEEDFGQDVKRWRRAARQLLNQLYRAKFVMGDLIHDVDDLHDKDKAGSSSWISAPPRAKIIIINY